MKSKIDQKKLLDEELSGDVMPPHADLPMNEIIRWGLDRLESMREDELADEVRRLRLAVDGQQCDEPP